MSKINEKRLLKIRRKTLGAFFKAKRLEANLTQNEFADLIKIGHVQNISNIERGIAEFSNQTLPRALYVLKIPFETYISLVLEIEHQRLYRMLERSMAKLKKSKAA